MLEFAAEKKGKKKNQNPFDDFIRTRREIDMDIGYGFSYDDTHPLPTIWVMAYH